MSAVRIVALLGLGLLVAAMASGHVPNSHVFALLTGQCLHKPEPAVCRRDPPAGRDI